MFGYSNVNSIVFESDSRCEVIAEYAFAHTTELENKGVVLPDSVKRVESKAFEMSCLQSITFGSGIEYIGKAALSSDGIGVSDSGSLQAVYFTTEKTFTIEGTNEQIHFLANSRDNALEYALRFSDPDTL